MDNNRLCNKCGLLPQNGKKPEPCTCKPKCKKPCKKKCYGDGFAFRKVVIPSALGDDITGKDKPVNGAYTNSYVEYEANSAQYMYDSYGIYTKLEVKEQSGVTDFNELTSRPKYNGEIMTGDTDIPEVRELVAGNNIDITDGVVSATYTHFTGTDGQTDGVAGLVPAPITADANKFLNSDGTWSDIDYNDVYPVGSVFASTLATVPTIAGGTWNEIGTQTIGTSTVHYYERTA